MCSVSGIKTCSTRVKFKNYLCHFTAWLILQLDWCYSCEWSNCWLQNYLLFKADFIILYYWQELCTLKHSWHPQKLWKDKLDTATIYPHLNCLHVSYFDDIPLNGDHYSAAHSRFWAASLKLKENASHAPFHIYTHVHSQKLLVSLDCDMRIYSIRSRDIVLTSHHIITIYKTKIHTTRFGVKILHTRLLFETWLYPNWTRTNK